HPRTSVPKACSARSEPHVVTNPSPTVYGQSPRCWSSVKKPSDPLLAASLRPESKARPNHPTPVDHHYEYLHTGMRNLFTALGLAAYGARIFFLHFPRSV